LLTSTSLEVRQLREHSYRKTQQDATVYQIFFIIPYFK